MSASSIGAERGGGYARYLESKTVEPERGDYYLTADGQLTEAPGRWLSGDDTLTRLGVDPDSPVEGADFIALMEGRHPGTGRWLRRAGADGSRGGGIDVTFSAPKSVSVVWALGDPWQREQIEAAHTRAVQRTVEYLRERVPVVRRRYDGQVAEEQAKDVIATAYRHTTARGVSGAEAPDPQLHTHVVITGAVREDDRFVAVASRPVFRAGRELGAFYRSALAQELVGEGYEVAQGTGRNGRYFEIAGVPRALCNALSGSGGAFLFVDLARRHGPGLVRQQVHQQAVVPSAAVGIALVLAHHADRPEADLLVCPDRGGVVGGGVDRDAVMPTLVDQVVNDASDRLASQPAAVQHRIEEDIDRRMTVPRRELLPVLDHARHGAVELDRQARGVGVVAPREAVRRIAPPARDLGRRVDPSQLALVAVGQGAEDHLRVSLISALTTSNTLPPRSEPILGGRTYLSFRTVGATVRRSLDVTAIVILSLPARRRPSAS
jgi:conjugative relaxase-like TrwC/TraI family protein